MLNNWPETPWLEQMSSTNHNQSDVGSSSTQESHDPPTFAAFSPHTGFTSVPANPRSVISIEKKTPLLISTPPQVTRALAQIYPYLLIANKLVGLLSWTTNDPWESFLALASFWAVVLYGDATLRYAGPLIAVVGLILCMYWRRFSPLSSSVWNEERRRRSQASKDLDDNTSHHKSLDHVIDTLKLFTLRCNILVDPLLELTNFLSTQQTAVSATTRPALTSLFIRIILLTPVWIVLTSPFVQFITTKRMVLTIGTISLTWHSAPAKVTRTILWRSRSVRQISAMVTGLRFSPVDDTSRKAEAVMLQTTRALKAQANTSKDGERGSAPQVIRFTFTLYENQRRWIGIGWTSSMLSYERASWTDDHLNPMPPKDEFHLPEVEGAGARWKWIEGVDWQLEGTELSSKNSASEQADKSHQEADAGWIYYDNKVISPKHMLLKGYY